jgi:hypothetical protein
MNSPHRPVRRRRSWLIRYYRAQAKVNIRVLGALRIIPAPVEASLSAWLRRTENQERGI